MATTEEAIRAYYARRAEIILNELKCKKQALSLCADAINSSDTSGLKDFLAILEKKIGSNSPLLQSGIKMFSSLDSQMLSEDQVVLKEKIKVLERDLVQVEVLAKKVSASNLEEFFEKPEIMFGDFKELFSCIFMAFKDEQRLNDLKILLEQLFNPNEDANYPELHKVTSDILIEIKKLKDSTTIYSQIDAAVSIVSLQHAENQARLLHALSFIGLRVKFKVSGEHHTLTQRTLTQFLQDIATLRTIPKKTYSANVPCGLFSEPKPEATLVESFSQLKL